MAEHKPICIPAASLESKKADQVAASVLPKESKEKEEMYACIPPGYLPVVYLNKTEKGFLDRLKALPFDKILDKGETEKACKAIEQEIFEYYKKKGGNDSKAGRQGILDFCDILGTHSTEKLERRYIEYAWDGIGDNNWKWFH